jgi:hypothetical protein
VVVTTLSLFHLFGSSDRKYTLNVKLRLPAKQAAYHQIRQALTSIAPKKLVINM